MVIVYAKKDGKTKALELTEAQYLELKRKGGYDGLGVMFAKDIERLRRYEEFFGAVERAGNFDELRA